MATSLSVHACTCVCQYVLGGGSICDRMQVYVCGGMVSLRNWYIM